MTPAAGQALAGVTTLTLTGTNFHPSKDSTLVYFAGKRIPAADVLSLTPTQITLRAPNLPQTGIPVKVSVMGAAAFSQTLTYALLPAVERLGETKRNEKPIGLTTDPAGNTYLSILDGSTSGGIRRLDPAGAATPYSSTTRTFPGLAFSQPAGGLLGVVNDRAIRIIAQGGVESVWFDLRNATPSTTAIRLRALDADDAGNVWAGGSNADGFYRVAADKSTTTFVSFPGAAITAIEARADFVYVLATVGGAVGVHRFPLSGSAVGARELYVDLTAALGAGLDAYALAFAADGTLYVGTNRVVDPVLIVPADTKAPASLYPGLLRLDVVDPNFPPAFRSDNPVVGFGWTTENRLVTAGPEVVATKASVDVAGDLVRITTLRTAEN